MSTLALSLLVAYFAGVLVTAVVVARREPAERDAEAGLLGLMTGLAWPVIVPVIALSTLVGKLARLGLRGSERSQ